MQDSELSTMDKATTKLLAIDSGPCKMILSGKNPPSAPLRKGGSDQIRWMKPADYPGPRTARMPGVTSFWNRASISSAV